MKPRPYSENSQLNYIFLFLLIKLFISSFIYVSFQGFIVKQDFFSVCCSIYQPKGPSSTVSDNCHMDKI